MGAFRCATNEKSVKTILKMEQIKLEESRKNEHQKIRRRPVPKQKNAPVVRQTAAGLLRESAMYAKKEQQSAAQLDQLMSGARDLTEYTEWRDQVTSEQREAAEMRKQREIDAKHAETETLKCELADLQRKRERADAKEPVRIKKRIAEIAEADRSANQARDQLQEEKSKLVKAQQAEKGAVRQKQERREKKEMEKRRQVIKEIRQLEAELIENRANNKTQVDMTETAGYNLLGEMSLLELRERLAMTTEKHKLEEEAKRSQISRDKKRFDQRLQMAAEKVQAHRLHKQKATPVKQTTPKVSENSRLVEMRKQLEEKQRERIRVQSEASYGSASRRSTPATLN